MAQRSITQHSALDNKTDSIYNHETGESAGVDAGAHLFGFAVNRNLWASIASYHSAESRDALFNRVKK